MNAVPIQQNMQTHTCIVIISRGSMLAYVYVEHTVTNFHGYLHIYGRPAWNTIQDR